MEKKFKTNEKIVTDLMKQEGMIKFSLKENEDTIYFVRKNNKWHQKNNTNKNNYLSSWFEITEKEVIKLIIARPEYHIV